MKEISNRSELLEKLTNISEECSDIESDATNSELSSEDEADYIQSETSDTEDSDEESITNDENKSVINMPRKRCRVLNSADSDEETENIFQETETAADGTVWSKFDEGGIPGRLPSTCIFKGVKGPTGYAKRNIMADNPISAFSLIIDNYIIKHIKKCTEDEGDLAAINAWILYKETTGIQIQRKEFLFQLAEQFSTEYRAARQKNSSEHEDPKRSAATSSNATHSNKRKIFQIRLCHNNKTNNICAKCQKFPP